jgi:hypothetical protein
MYVGIYGMGESLISAGLMADPMQGRDAIQMTLADRDRRKEIDTILEECRGRVRMLLQQKRHVVEGLRDQLLRREELIGDEIEEVMAELGEREPMELPAGVLSGNGHGDGAISGNGHGNRQPQGNGSANGGLDPGQAPPRPDR